MLEFFRDYLAPSGGIHVVSILPDAFDPSQASKGRHFGTDYEAAAAWCSAENVAGKNVYWTANCVRADLHKKPTKADITAIRVAHVDIDPPKDTPQWDKQAALSDLVTRGAPSVVISSGAGWQALWWLNEATDAETIERVNRGLAAAFNADHCWNVDRLLRVPGGGLINWPDKRKQSLGRVPVATDLQQPFNGQAYTPAALLATFPAPETTVVSEALPDGPDPRWTLGDKTDDEIIKIMLAERPNLAASFGQGATVRDLWEGNEEVLSACYPGPSEYDMALINKISFYWGRNPAKIEEIFGRSALGKRDKWLKRPEYRAITIGKVVMASENVYSVVRDTPTVMELPGVTAPLQGEVVPGGEFMTIYEQKQHFDGCVYVMNEHKVLVPNGTLMKPDQFNSMYGGYNFEFGTEAVEKKAFPAFTESRLYRFPKVTKTMFNPRLPFGHIERDAVNTYLPDPYVRSEPGDVTPFLRHVELQYPDPRDREIVWTWCAALVQNPGVKFQWALFLQGAEGNGKSMLAEVIKMSVGIGFYHKPNASDITNKFNDFMMRKLFIDVQEINIDDRYEVVENLKDWITSSWIEVQPKGGAKMMTENYANWMLVSNHKNAVPLTANQRRFAPVFAAQQTAEDVARVFGGEYFPQLWKWLREGGYAYMTHYLQTRPLTEEFNPAGTGQAAARAPNTSSTVEAIGASMGRFESEIIEAVEAGREGFRGGWVSSIALRKLEEDLRLRLNPAKRKAALESLGYVKWGRSTVMIMREGGEKPVLYCKNELMGGDVASYERGQGYSL